MNMELVLELEEMLTHVPLQDNVADLIYLDNRSSGKFHSKLQLWTAVRAWDRRGY